MLSDKLNLLLELVQLSLELFYLLVLHLVILDEGLKIGLHLFRSSGFLEFLGLLLQLYDLQIFGAQKFLQVADFALLYGDLLAFLHIISEEVVQLLVFLDHDLEFLLVASQLLVLLLDAGVEFFVFDYDLSDSLLNLFERILVSVREVSLLLELLSLRLELFAFFSEGVDFLDLVLDHVLESVNPLLEGLQLLRLLLLLLPGCLLLFQDLIFLVLR